jgi:hypothetical protein
LSGDLSVPGFWSIPPGADIDAFASSITLPYRGDDERYVYPALGGATMPLHPLLAWWAILFTLSMLARYEPAAWMKHISVDSSPDAVPLKNALDRGLDVPDSHTRP